MKKSGLMVLFVLFGFSVFSQTKPIAVIAPITTRGGLTESDAETATELLTSQIVSQNRLTIVDRTNLDSVMREMRFQLSDWTNDSKAAQLGKAVKAQYLIRGQLMKMDGQFFLSATMQDIEGLQIVASANKQFSSLGQILTILPDFTNALAEGIAPAPKGPANPLVGVWICNSYGGRYTCVIEFTNDERLIIHSYDYVDGRNGTGNASGDGRYEFNNGSFNAAVTLYGFLGRTQQIRAGGSMRGNNQLYIRGFPYGNAQGSGVVTGSGGLYEVFMRQ
jgi:hypothetical protein